MSYPRRYPRAAAVRCPRCARPFAQGYVPQPDARGRLICRDCRDELPPVIYPPVGRADGDE